MSSYTTDNYGAAAPQQHEVDLVRLLVEMIDHRTMILCVTFLFTLCAGLYAGYAPCLSGGCHGANRKQTG